MKGVERVQAGMYVDRVRQRQLLSSQAGIQLSWEEGQGGIDSLHYNVF